MSELNLDMLRTMATMARQSNVDVVLDWRVLLALLDEIQSLRSQLSERPAQPTPPEVTALREEAPHEQAGEPPHDDE